MNKIYILGMGPGGKEYILPKTSSIIEDCQVLVGGSRHLSRYGYSNKKLIPIGKDLEEAVHLAKKHGADKKVAFLLSGDTGFYSMLNYLKTRFAVEELEIVPGISSFQYMAARIGECWQDAFVGSFHGRELDLVDILKKYKKIFLLTDNKNTPSEIARILFDNNYKDRMMIVGEELSYEKEKITIGRPEDIMTLEGFNMAVVVIKDEVEV